MKAAVIDLGTNTFHLIIADLSSKDINILFKTNEPVRLGEGRINDSIIIPEAFERGINTLKNFRKEIDKHNNIDVVKAVATSAIRSAANGTDFINSAKQDAGIMISIATGDEEADYIFNGVKATGSIKGMTLIMDIGGGSTEFIICDEDTLFWKKSYNIGAARLMQAYFKSDPISNDDQTSINKHLDAELTDLIAACALYQPEHLIGSAGAFETFTAMIYPEKDIKNLKSAPIDLPKYQNLAQNLIFSTHAERDLMPNLIKLRVDMIVIAVLITNYVINNCKIKQLSLSTYDLKMGILYQLRV
ncbi:exopolyphosphatase [Pedobacter sp. ASV1-7]|uniref:Ppx/GppA phosphatase family protein n=1 Tax=Pedobacter sp. ASV1-7 TaxID=3145237 RepID=UPI0032E9323C